MRLNGFDQFICIYGKAQDTTSCRKITHQPTHINTTDPDTCATRNEMFSTYNRYRRTRTSIFTNTPPSSQDSINNFLYPTDSSLLKTFTKSKHKPPKTQHLPLTFPINSSKLLELSQTQYPPHYSP